MKTHNLLRLAAAGLGLSLLTCSVIAQTPIPLSIQCPANLTVWTCSTNPLVVTYPAPTTSDDCPGNPTVTCMPRSAVPFPLGTTTVNCTAANTCREQTNCNFTVTVLRDTTPPLIQCPTNLVVLSCDRAGAIVNYPAPTVSDNQDPTPTVTCAPASGSLFAPGTTIVVCTATDSCTNLSTCTFTVTVNPDTTPPVIQCPSNIVLWTCSTSAITHFGVTAMDDYDTNVTITCTPPVGTPLPVGDTTVTCVARDDCNNTSQCSFQVRVIRDTTPPVITCPSNIVFNCLCPGQIIILDFFQATATDDLDPDPTIMCDPPSLVSSPGVHVVTCTATDNCGNSNRCQFTVTFNYDTTPPAITCPSNMTVWTCANSAVVNYSVSATDNCDANVDLICSPPSGSLFPIGTTTVTCIATDNCTNRGTCTFTVTVRRDGTAPRIQCPSNLTVYASSASGAKVVYNVTAQDDSGSVFLTCDPPSDSVFRIGVTTVTCEAPDACDNTTGCRFEVHVRAPTLTIGPMNGRLAIAWQGDAVLEEADSVDGLWRPVAGARSPYLITTLAPQKFFRFDGFLTSNLKFFSLDRFEQNIRDALAGQCIGYGYAINRNGQLARSGGDGSARTEADPPALAMSETRRINVASVSKTITAVAVMKLLEQKNMDIDDPVAAYLPSDWVLGPGVETLTFKDLLTHTSGLTNCGDSTYGALQSDIETGLGDKAYQYCNHNFALFRIIIPYLWGMTDLDGEPDKDTATATLYEEYVRTQVLLPMGVDAWTHATEENPTLCYQFPYDQNPGYEPGDSLFVAGPKGWFLSAFELAAFLAHWRYGTILSETSKDLMRDQKLGLKQYNGLFGTYYHHRGDLSYGISTCIIDFPINMQANIQAINIQASLVINSDLGLSQAQLLIDAFEGAWVDP